MRPRETSQIEIQPGVGGCRPAGRDRMGWQSAWAGAAVYCAALAGTLAEMLADYAASK